MDFGIDTSGGQGEMTFLPVTDIRNNIFLSLSVIKGACFWDPDFGLRDIRPAKNTQATADLLRDYCRDALQWIIDCGRAISIEVTIERDPQADPDRMKILVEAVQADGKIVTFETYQGVV